MDEQQTPETQPADGGTLQGDPSPPTGHGTGKVIPQWRVTLGKSLIVIAVVAALILGVRVVKELSVPRLEKVAEACELPSLLVVHDNGKSLSVRAGGKEASFSKIEDIACVLRELEAPNYVIAHIDSTRALDGQQTAQWDGFTARWTYHPDPGLSLTLIDD